MADPSPQYAAADNTVLTGFTTLAPGTSIGGTGSYFGSNVVFSSGFRYVASDGGWFMRSDGATGVSFHAGPAGTAGAPFSDTVAWAVSPSGVFSLPAAPLAVSSGGTGAATAAAARTALGACSSTMPAIQGAPVVTVGGDFVGERFITGPYGVAHYYDGSNYYFLVTQSGQQNSTNYSGIRPFHVDLASGKVGMENGLSVNGGLSADSLTLSGPFSVTAKGGSASRALSSRFADQLSVLDFGAVGDGQADDTAAIQAALNAAANGVSLLVPPLAFKVSSTLLMGNGSGDAASTQWGVTLKGHSPAPFPAECFAGFPKTGTARLVWAGAAGGTMVKVAGPLNSWGLSNLYLDGAGVAGVGIDVVSASNGECRNLSLTGFTGAAIREGVLASYKGFGLANSMHNAYDNIAINVPGVSGAKGVVQTGVPNASPTPANSCFARFTNVTVFAPGGTVATYGFCLQWTDTNLYQNIHYVGGNANSACFLFDYTLQDNLPSACTILGIDPSGNGTTSRQFVNNGVPGTGARPNTLKGLGEINRGRQPNIANLRPDLPQVVATLDLAGLSQPITNSPLFTPYEDGLFRTSVYLRISSKGGSGTLAARVTAFDGVGALNLDLNPAVSAAGGATFGAITYRAAGGCPVNYSVVFQNTSAAPTYSLTMSTERIG